GYAGASLSGKCWGRVPDGGTWAKAAVPCSPGALNGYAGETPLPPFALQWIGAFASDTEPVTALDLRRDGTYSAPVNGAKQQGSFTGTSAGVYSMDGGSSGAGWTATVAPWSGNLTVTVGSSSTEVLAGHPALEDACDATGGLWTDDDVDPATGLFCICS